MRVKNSDVEEMENRIEYLEQKIDKLEEIAGRLEGKIFDVDGNFNSLLVKFGRRIRKVINDEVDMTFDEYEERLLKKLVNSDMFELKMREKK